MKCLLIVPVFNEGIKLKSVCERVSQFLNNNPSSLTEAMIIDDGSTEDDARILAEKHRFHYLRNETRKGVGYSIRKAYYYGLESNFEILATMAGNNKDNPDELLRLLNPIRNNQADFVQGSRYLSGGNYGNMPGYRFFSTRFLHPGLFSLISGKKITDSTNGFRAVSKRVFQDSRLNLNQEWLDQYELEPYLFYKSIKLGYRVSEVAVTKIYPEKKLGYSKMKPFIGWWSILRPIIFLGLGIKK